MDLEEAYYIKNYFSRLMTELENKANRHYSYSLKLGANKNNNRKILFEKKNFLTKDPEVLKLLANGYENFVLNTAKRIKKESFNEYRLNKCPKCACLTRTPYAKQCKKCGNKWHNEIAGEFLFEDAFKIEKRPLFWIVGELTKGIIELGDKIDFTSFQLNIIAEIKGIECTIKLKKGVKKEFFIFGIEASLEEQKQIKKYVTKSAKILMIIKAEKRIK